VGWSGKVLGGLFGGIVGGPLGMAAGVALGHWVADGAGDEPRRDLPLELVKLEWQHHVFRPVGPGVLLTPTWVARGLDGVDVDVRLRVLGTTWSAVVVPEEDPETCSLPEVFVPYTALPEDHVIVEVRLAAGEASDRARYRVPLPTPVRRQGGSGPARVVMALVAAARAGGRTLERDDVRFVRTRFVEAYPLDEAGLAWLKLWMRTLRDADPARLTPEKVAARLARHVDGDQAATVVSWLMHGTRAAWPGAAQERYVDDLAEALGIDAIPLWAEVDGNPAELTRAGAAAILGVPMSANPDTVRAAWKRLVQETHPDRNASDEVEATRRTARINAAYGVLK
jgi:DnaJ-domain-containing protein 1